jgi:CMP/dCMP kinase
MMNLRCDRSLVQYRSVWYKNVNFIRQLRRLYSLIQRVLQQGRLFINNSRWGYLPEAQSRGEGVLLNQRPIITIDGPAGAGKSTISKLLASRLSCVYLDTGALYRAVAYQLKHGGWNGIEETVGDSLRMLKISLRNEDGSFRIVVNGEDVSEKIRTEEIGSLASKISAIPQVRKNLLPVQREMAAEGGLVAEGRDMGTVVFPTADVKFFLDASPEERARRRYLEMISKGEKVNLKDIEIDMLRRDNQDRLRSIAPLKIPENAFVIDSSKLSIPQVVDFMISVIDRLCPIKA